jgi:GDPmannose 4,6-dehydratase
VREFAEAAFTYAGLDPERYVATDSALMRPAEVDHLVGDASRAHADLGWEPRVEFSKLVEMMVDADLARLSGAVTTVHSRPLVQETGEIRAFAE